MRKLLWVVVAVTVLAASPLANAQGVQGALDTEYQEARHHAANLVLRPEAPLEGISEDEVKTVADGSGMTTEEAQFILFEGSAIIVDFISANRTNPEFGAVEVRQNGKLEIRLRVTSASSQLPEELEGKLARPVETLVGGHSAAELDVAYDAAENLMHDVKARTGEYPPFRIEKDFESGLVVLQLSSSAELDKLEATLIPPHVVISTDQPLQLRSATVYAGQTLYPDRTVGFVAKNSSSGARGLVTAGHCPDTNVKAGADPVGNAFAEVCTNTDRQLHNIPVGSASRIFLSELQQRIHGDLGRGGRLVCRAKLLPTRTVH